MCSCRKWPLGRCYVVVRYCDIVRTYCILSSKRPPPLFDEPMVHVCIYVLYIQMVVCACATPVFWPINVPALWEGWRPPGVRWPAVRAAGNALSWPRPAPGNGRRRETFAAAPRTHTPPCLHSAPSGASGACSRHGPHQELRGGAGQKSITALSWQWAQLTLYTL